MGRESLNRKGDSAGLSCAKSPGTSRRWLIEAPCPVSPRLVPVSDPPGSPGEESFAGWAVTTCACVSPALCAHVCLRVPGALCARVPALCHLLGSGPRLGHPHRGQICDRTPGSRRSMLPSCFCSVDCTLLPEPGTRSIRPSVLSKDRVSPFTSVTCSG